MREREAPREQREREGHSLLDSAYFLVVYMYANTSRSFVCTLMLNIKRLQGVVIVDLFRHYRYAHLKLCKCSNLTASLYIVLISYITLLISLLLSLNFQSLMFFFCVAFPLNFKQKSPSRKQRCVDHSTAVSVSSVDTSICGTHLRVNQSLTVDTSIPVASPEVAKNKQL